MSDPTPAPSPDYSNVDVFRVMSIWQGRSGLPEDRFVNTFHFLRLSDIVVDPADYTEVAGFVQEFWESQNVGQTRALSSYLSDLAIDPLAAHEIRVYNLAEAEPREPHFYPLTKTSAGTNAALPNECAAVLSYYADRNVPRQRGRLYIGPLEANAVTPDTTDHDMRLITQFREDLAFAAAQLVTSSSNRWGVLSRGLYADGQVAASFRPVTGGWVDNAVDIVRKRGVKASARLTWAV